MRFPAVVILLFFCLTARAQTTFVIESLPSATPDPDTIFITGTFNNWTPNDPAFALKRQLNGQLAITIAIPSGDHEYKFTRGSWTKVETDASNQYTRNRAMRFGAKETVFVRIENWLDLGGARPLNYFVFYFFACAFQGIALCFLVYRIQRADHQRLRSFVTFNAVITALLFLLVFHAGANQIWKSYFTFVFHIAMFCWTPLLAWFYHSQLRDMHPLRLSKLMVPALLMATFILLRLFNVKAIAGLAEPIFSALNAGHVVIVGSGIVFNGLMIVWMLNRYPELRFSAWRHADPRIRMLASTLWLSALALLFISANIVLLARGVDNMFVDNYYMTAIGLSFIIFIETYFAWRYPEVLKEEKASSPAVDNLSDWIEKLNALMIAEKPFRNVDLTVSDLAEMLGTRPHVLSRVINDAHQKNFRDFVNAWRIEEFIRLANTREYRHYTFLALAQEVGFNSKSTFNLAFKKITNQSPREYFKSREEKV